MAIKQHKPVTPARRQQTVAAFDDRQSVTIKGVFS